MDNSERKTPLFVFSFVVLGELCLRIRSVHGLFQIMFSWLPRLESCLRIRSMHVPIAPN